MKFRGHWLAQKFDFAKLLSRTYTDTPQGEKKCLYNSSLL